MSGLWDLLVKLKPTTLNRGPAARELFHRADATACLHETVSQSFQTLMQERVRDARD